VKCVRIAGLIFHPSSAILRVVKTRQARPEPAAPKSHT
jgi:hypothetical protein